MKAIQKASEAILMCRKWFRRVLLTLCITMLVFVCLSACGSQKVGQKGTANHHPNDENIITVGLYPYVPDIEWTEHTLTTLWTGSNPDIKLEFVDLDCYTDADPTGIDVFMYDSLFINYFVENNPGFRFCAVYAVLVRTIATDTDIMKAIWTCMGYTVLLCFTLFKTGSLAKSVFNAH